jgi:glycosyltransferase involved in cell wall biosynthesis
MTADTVGGVWTYAVELINALQPYNINFYLATMGAPLSPYQREIIKGLKNAVLFESNYKLEWMEDPWEDLKASGRWLLELEKVFQPDIIHLNGYVHASLPFSTPKLVIAHSCVYSWLKAVLNTQPGEEWKRYKSEVTKGLHSADFITAPSYSMLSALKEFYGEFNAYEPIYNGISPKDFSPGKKEPFILSAGRLWDEAKNILTLSDIAPQLNWKVFIAGDNHHPVNNKNFSFGYNDHDTTVWLGCLKRKELAEYMSRASIFVLPALYEPFGLSVLEAAYSGCALILSNISSLKEIWKDSALYIEPDDKSGLTRLINNLIEDKQLLEIYSKKALQRAHQFKPEIMAEKYLSLYKKLSNMQEKIGIK